MKKLILTILLILIILVIPHVTDAQNKCKYDVDTYDKFLKIRKLEKEVKVNKANAGGNGYLKLDFCKYDSLVFFRITYILRDGIVVGKDDKIIFLLEDDSSVRAFPNQIYSGDMRVATSQFVLNASYFFENYDDMEKLKTKKVKSIRIYYNSVYRDQDIKDRFSDMLQNTAQCF